MNHKHRPYTLYITNTDLIHYTPQTQALYIIHHKHRPYTLYITNTGPIHYTSQTQALYIIHHKHRPYTLYITNTGPIHYTSQTYSDKSQCWAYISNCCVRHDCRVLTKPSYNSSSLPGNHTGRRQGSKTCQTPSLARRLHAKTRCQMINFRDRLQGMSINRRAAAGRVSANCLTKVRK